MAPAPLPFPAPLARAIPQAMPPRDSLPVLPFDSASGFEAWLEKNHQSAKGLWLKLARPAAMASSVTYAEALEVALCFGWIDGQKGALDDSWWLQRFTPRSPRSKWSKINREKAEALIAQGKMRPAGLREVEAAKSDGRWEAAYDGQRKAQVPDDLQKALDASPRARAFFDQLDSANRYAILYRVGDAKKPETRARRIAQFVTMLEEGRKLH